VCALFCRSRSPNLPLLWGTPARVDRGQDSLFNAFGSSCRCLAPPRDEAMPRIHHPVVELKRSFGQAEEERTVPLPDPQTRVPTTVCAVAGLIAALVPVNAFSQQIESEKLIEAGHWKKARAAVVIRIRQSPGDAFSYYLLSQIHHAFGDDAAPQALAEKAVALDGRVAKYHRQLAETVGIQAQHANPFQLVVLARQFRKELDTAIALDPHDVLAQRDLLEYYLVAPGIAGGDMQKASAVADHIAELDATEGLLAKARVAQFRKQTAQTEALLRRAVDTQPSGYKGRIEWTRFCLTKLRSERSESASAATETAAREALKLDRSRAEPYAILAEVYAGRSDWNTLEATLADAAQQAPDDLAPWYRAAETLLALGREPARAERYLRTYLAQEPEGNEPTLADARRKLDLAAQAQNGASRVRNTRADR